MEDIRYSKSKSGLYYQVIKCKVCKKWVKNPKCNRHINSENHQKYVSSFEKKEEEPLRDQERTELSNLKQLELEKLLKQNMSSNIHEQFGKALIETSDVTKNGLYIKKGEDFASKFSNSKYISNWEHQFLTNILKYDNLTTNQKVCKQNIISKLERYKILKK